MSATRPRDGAYIWVTWIAALLSGNNSCAWAPWFKAHYFFEKVGDFDQEQWQAQHQPLVEYWRDRLGMEGFAVTEESDNKFTLARGPITLAGQPDLIATSDDRVVVVDCKSGAPRSSHRTQVMIYMAAVSSARPELRGRSIDGLIQYQDDSVEVPADSVDEEFRLQLRETIHSTAGDTAPPKDPTFHNCRYCPIGSGDCPERVAAEAEVVTDHDLF